MRSWLRTPIPAILVNLLLEWNTYLLFNSDIVVFGEWGVVGWDRKLYLGPAEITSFSSRDLRRRNKHNSFWFVVSTGYFYILFLGATVSDFLPLVLPLSSITFTAKSQDDKHFYKYIYLFQILYGMKAKQNTIKIHVTVFYIQIWFKCKKVIFEKQNGIFF